MEFTPFKLLIAVIVSFAFLYIFFTVFAQYFFWPESAQKQIETAITAARANTGKAIEAEKTVFETETRFSSITFREPQLEIRFECNSASSCCDNGVSCSNEIEWTPANVFFKQKKQLLTFVRCDSQHNIAACTVFFGQKPAQLVISSANSLEKMDLLKENQYSIDLLVKNDGSIFAPGVFAKATLYKLNSQKTSRELVFETTSETTDIGPGEQKLIPLTLQVDLASNYLVEIIVQGENSGFDKKTIEFTATGTLALCIPLEKGETVLDTVAKKCEKSYYCSGCSFAFECANAWKEKEPEKEFVATDPKHTVVLTDPVSGNCPEETD